MSLTALSQSFADTYVNAPAAARAKKPEVAAALNLRGAAGAAAMAVGSAPSPPADSTTADPTVTAFLKALTDYIPSEVLTAYIAAIAAIENWSFKFPGSDKLSADALAKALVPIQHEYLLDTFIICLIASPLWILIGVYLSSKTKPSIRAFAWPMTAATIAFFVYAFVVPESWLSATYPNGGLFSTLLLLSTTPILHTFTMLYAKVFPPLA